MNYVPKSEEQIIKEGLFTEGEYDFEVVKTSDKPNKEGGFMITLTLRFFGDDNREQLVTDYISPNSNYGERKLRHAADACGLTEAYEAGSLIDTDFADKSGRAKLKIQPASNGYNPKNVVADYIKRIAEVSAHVAAKANGYQPQQELNDEIPF